MLKPKQEAFYQRVRALYQEAGYAVPSPRQASRIVGAPPDAVRAMLRIGVERGEFAKVGEDLYYPIETLQRLAETLRTLQPPLKVATVRDLTGTSRRIAHALLSWLREQGWVA